MIKIGINYLYLDQNVILHDIVNTAKTGPVCARFDMATYFSVLDFRQISKMKTNREMHFKEESDIFQHMFKHIPLTKFDLEIRSRFPGVGPGFYSFSQNESK